MSEQSDPEKKKSTPPKKDSDKSAADEGAGILFPVNLGVDDIVLNDDFKFNANGANPIPGEKGSTPFPAAQSKLPPPLPIVGPKSSVSPGNLTAAPKPAASEPAMGQAVTPPSLAPQPLGEKKGEGIKLPSVPVAPPEPVAKAQPPPLPKIGSTTEEGGHRRDPAMDLPSLAASQAVASDAARKESASDKSGDTHLTVSPASSQGATPLTVAPEGAPAQATISTSPPEHPTPASPPPLPTTTEAKSSQPPTISLPMAGTVTTRSSEIKIAEQAAPVNFGGDVGAMEVSAPQKPVVQPPPLPFKPPTRSASTPPPLPPSPSAAAPAPPVERKPVAFKRVEMLSKKPAQLYSRRKRDEERAAVKEEPKPAPEAAPKIEAKVETKIEAKVEPKVEPKVEAKVEPKVEPEPGLKPEPKVELKTESKAAQPPPLPVKQPQPVAAKLPPPLPPLSEQGKEKEKPKGAGPVVPGQNPLSNRYGLGNKLPSLDKRPDRRNFMSRRQRGESARAIMPAPRDLPGDDAGATVAAVAAGTAEADAPKPRKVRKQLDPRVRAILRISAYCLIFIGIGVVCYFNLGETRLEVTAVPPDGATLGHEVAIVRDFRSDLFNILKEIKLERAPLDREVRERTETVRRAKGDIAQREERLKLFKDEIQNNQKDVEGAIKKAHDDMQALWDGPGNEVEQGYDQKLAEFKQRIEGRAKQLNIAYTPNTEFESPEVWVNAFRLALYDVPKTINAASERAWAEKQLAEWRTYLKSYQQKIADLKAQVEKMQASPAPHMTEITQRNTELEQQIKDTEAELEPLRKELSDNETALATVLDERGKKETVRRGQIFQSPVQEVLTKIPAARGGNFSWRNVEQLADRFGPGDYLLWIKTTKGDEEYWSVVPFTLHGHATTHLMVEPTAFFSVNELFKSE